MKKRGNIRKPNIAKESENDLSKSSNSEAVKEDFFTATNDSLSEGIAEVKKSNKNEDISNDFFLSGFSSDD